MSPLRSLTLATTALLTLLFSLEFSFAISVHAVSPGYGHSRHSPPKISHASKQPYKSIAYYVNWATYARNFQPQNLTVDTLTHVHYAFANVSPSNGTVYLSDSYADLKKKFPTDSLNETGNNLYGCVKQLYILKKHNRHLKTILSIGGATYTKNFAKALATARGRSTFANSSVALLADLGFDGLEIDWESPANSIQAGNFVSLLKEIRCALDEYASGNNLDYKFALTTAVSANATHFNIPHFAAMDKYLDYWNLMAYDYAGSFTNLTGHASNLYPSHYNKLSTPFSTQRALDTYLSSGVPSHKMTLGMPLYGRAFLDTTGLGKPYHGVGNGSWGEAGIWDYKALPMAGAKEVYDPDVGGSYSHTTANCTTSGGGQGHTKKSGGECIVSYDNKKSAETKAKYIVEKGLGGGMWWESSGDKAGDESLIATVAKALDRKGGLDRRQNWLRYPTSQYENVKNGMEGA